MSFRYLPDIATADIAFEAEGKTIEELFLSAAEAVSDSMVDLEGVEKKIEKEIELENKEIGQLLYNLLEDIIFYKDAEQLVFSDFNIKISKNEAYRLTGKMRGDKIDPEKHELRNDVKAVSLHRFEVKQTDKGWYCRVILDI